jgi:hypothetical protein
VNTPLLNGTSCSNGNACDGEEVCNAGTCLAGVPPDCDDRNFCTIDSCDNSSGCQHTGVPNCCNADAQCSDSDQCTVNERCTAQHTCVSDARNCDDGNACTQDSCNPQIGCVHTPLGSGTCDDANLCTSGDTCTGGSCVGTPVDCSDGNLCNGLESCVPATGQCTVPSSQLTCTPGNRGSRSCEAEWLVANPNNPGSILSTIQICRQGDPSCDFDTDLATCSFHVAVCLRVPDPRLNLPCTPTDVVGYHLSKPSLRAKPAAANALLAALSTLSGASVVPKRPNARTFNPPISSVACTPEATIVVPLKRTLGFHSVTTTISGKKDIDSLRLRCKK